LTGRRGWFCPSCRDIGARNDFAPIHLPDSMIMQVAWGCGLGRTRINGICVSRAAIRQDADVCDGQDALALGGFGESLGRLLTGSRGRTASPGGPSEMSWRFGCLETTRARQSSSLRTVSRMCWRVPAQPSQTLLFVAADVAAVEIARQGDKRIKQRSANPNPRFHFIALPHCGV
jgi:hypothetical protein